MKDMPAPFAGQGIIKLYVTNIGKFGTFLAEPAGFN